MFIGPPSIVGNTTPDSKASVHDDGVPQGYRSSAVLITDEAIAGRYGTRRLTSGDTILT